MTTPIPIEMKKSEACFLDAGASEDPSLANKPDEPPFKMTLNANKVEFPFAPLGKPVSVIIRLHNPLPKRQTFKIRCTSTDIFRVAQPIGFVNPHTTILIAIWFTNDNKESAINKKHFFAFYHKMAFAAARLAPPLWKEGKKDWEGVRRIPVCFLGR